ncbi:MAG: response regulator transcription factor [Myxococcota bacterium]
MDGRPVVLVAEDDDALRKMIGHLLSDFADVRLAPDGLTAWEWMKAQDRGPDLLVTDLMMPRMDGLTLVQHIKAHATLSRTPVIMLTAKDRPTDVVTGINAGARHYLTKPFRGEELVAKIKKVLRLD